MKLISKTTIAASLLLGASVLAAPGRADAVPLLGEISFDDVGIGNLSGYNPLNIIDGQTAGVSVDLSETAAGLVTTDQVSETLDGHAFSLTQRGSQTGTVPIYVAGFTFNLGAASYLQYVPSSPNEAWAFIEDAPVLLPATSTSVVNIAPVTFVGGVDTSSFADLPAGKYTLVLAGISGLAVGQSTSFGGTISAVPLPGPLAMFGSALLGLTLFGTRRRARA